MYLIMPSKIPELWMAVTKSMIWVLHAVKSAVSSSLTITQLKDVSTKLHKLLRLTGKEQ